MCLKVHDFLKFWQAQCGNMWLGRHKLTISVTRLWKGEYRPPLVELSKIFYLWIYSTLNIRSNKAILIWVCFEKLHFFLEFRLSWPLLTMFLSLIGSMLHPWNLTFCGLESPWKCLIFVGVILYEPWFHLIHVWRQTAFLPLQSSCSDPHHVLFN